MSDLDIGMVKDNAGKKYDFVNDNRQKRASKHAKDHCFAWNG
jgi:hypothetical protein